MAVSSIWSNRLRTGLTLLAVSIGVFAIISVAMVALALEKTLVGQLESLGSTTFMINRMPSVSMGHTWRLYRNRPDITLRQGLDLKRRVGQSALVSLRRDALGKVVRYQDVTTDPNVTLIGSDESWTALRDFSVMEGRSLSEADVQSFSDVAVIGSDLAEKLFRSAPSVGHAVSIDGHRYTIIGEFLTKGASMTGSQDNFLLIPITSATKYFFDEWTSSVSIAVRPNRPEDLDETLSKTVVEMRSVRGLDIGVPANFEIETNQAISESFSSLTDYAGYFGLSCGMIALIAAGVGIMNIMLVSVKERTREIGVRKALGATRFHILYQFLVEALTLSQLGALGGIAIGIAAGAAVSSMMNVDPSVPWSWVLSSFLVCTGIGMLFGLYPAWRAAQLDPIEALRYE